MLKSQDILVVAKLASLQIQHRSLIDERSLEEAVPSDWHGWELESAPGVPIHEAKLASMGDDLIQQWTYAQLSQSLGLSASECNACVKRALLCGLLRLPRGSKQPVPIGPALLEFIRHGIKYVFPAEEGALTRGVPTAFAAPVLPKRLLSGGDHIYVWPDARGREMGLSLQPLHKSVPYAVRNDATLYKILALADAIRFGHPRELKVAAEQLEKVLNNL